MTQGRLGRLGYFGRCFGVFLVPNVLIQVGVQSHSEGLTIIGGLLGLAAFVLAVTFAVRRLHDLDRPGTDYFYLLIPIYNFYFALVMVFQRGTVGANKYGPDPIAS